MKSLTLLAFSAAVLCAQNAAIVELHDNWQIQSSAKVGQPGEAVSSVKFQPAGWYRTSVPTTVLAALAEDKVYPDPFFGLNLKSIPGFKEGRWLVMPKDSPFRSSWWYRKEFTLAPAFRGKHLALHLDGINYQANVWLNGRRIADSNTCIGAFRRFEFPIDAAERNVLAIEIIAPGQGEDKAYGTKQIEATTGWDDHNPEPPDLNMGIWRKVYISATGPVTMRDPYISTKLNYRRWTRPTSRFL